MNKTPAAVLSMSAAVIAVAGVLLVFLVWRGAEAETSASPPVAEYPAVILSWGDAMRGVRCEDARLEAYRAWWDAETDVWPPPEEPTLFGWASRYLNSVKGCRRVL